MSALEIVIIIVALGAALYGVAVATGVVAPLQRNRRGAMWIDHPDEVPVADQPRDDDDRQAPIPRRTLRGRPPSE